MKHIAYIAYIACIYIAYITNHRNIYATALPRWYPKFRILEGCKQRLIINIAREVIKNYETVFFKYVSYITLMILNFSF